MSGNGAMDEMERAGSRLVRRALRAGGGVEGWDHKRRERARKKSGCGVAQVARFLELSDGPLARLR
jgi:hypothetical protein